MPYSPLSLPPTPVDDIPVFRRHRPSHSSKRNRLPFRRCARPRSTPNRPPPREALVPSPPSVSFPPTRDLGRIKLDSICRNSERRPPRPRRRRTASEFGGCAVRFDRRPRKRLPCDVWVRWMPGGVRGEFGEWGGWLQEGSLTEWLELFLFGWLALGIQ